MAYLFEPARWTNTTVLHGRGLRYSFPVSMTVWKDANGVWRQAQTPSYEEMLSAQHWMQGTPQIISDTLAAELIAAGVGTCTPITA